MKAASYPVSCAARPWPAAAAVLLLLGAVLPPVATYAERCAFAQALQFAAFAILAPALLAVGMLITWVGERDSQEDEQPELTGRGPASVVPARRPPHSWRRRGVR
jgi:hypothetical protein